MGAGAGNPTGAFACKSIEALQAEAGSHGLRRALGPLHLVLFGIGCILGAGIYVLPGTAAANFAGPAVMLSFVLAGTACAEEEIFPVVAHNQFTNGVTLRTYCDSNREAARAYVSGWHDKRYVDMTFIDFPASKLPDEYLVQNAHGAIAGRFCLPKDITLEQLTDAVCAHVAAVQRSHGTSPKPAKYQPSVNIDKTARERNSKNSARPSADSSMRWEARATPSGVSSSTRRG